MQRNSGPPSSTLASVTVELGLSERMKRQARLNRAARLGRMPNIVGDRVLGLLE